MAKKRKASQRKSTAPVKRKRKLNWSKIAKNGLFASVIAAIFGVAIYFYSASKQVDYDLSVIGKGKPAVVQIHDPNCQLCQRLKRNLDSVKGDFADDMHFKIANIKAKTGRDFARQHNVRHVTLLFFDKQGKRVHTIEGVTPSSEIKAALLQLNSRIL